jgi:hypothetical protein
LLPEKGACFAISDPRLADSVIKPLLRSDLILDRAAVFLADHAVALLNVRDHVLDDALREETAEHVAAASRAGSSGRSDGSGAACAGSADGGQRAGAAAER